MTAATPRSLALALILLGVAVPAGLVASPAAGSSGCQAGHQWGTTENITRSSPLAGSTTAVEALHRVAHEADRGEVLASEANGLDAYVYPLGCVAQERGVNVQLFDETQEPLSADYELAFYSERFRPTGDRMDGEPGAEFPQISGTVPAYTSYVVVVLEDAPLFAGIDTSENPPTPYSGQFRLSFRK